MRETIFNAIISLLQGVTKLTSETGKVHVYDWPVTAPAGYPYVVVGSQSVESEELSNMQDLRSYIFSVQIVGEKFGDEGGKTQRDALQVMREVEDIMFSTFDGNNDLGLGLQIIVTRPINIEWSYTEDRQRVVLSMRVLVQAAVDITL